MATTVKIMTFIWLYKIFCLLHIMLCESALCFHTHWLIRNKWHQLVNAHINLYRFLSDAKWFGRMRSWSCGFQGMSLICNCEQPSGKPTVRNNRSPSASDGINSGWKVYVRICKSDDISHTTTRTTDKSANWWRNACKCTNCWPVHQKNPIVIVKHYWAVYCGWIRTHKTIKRI